MTSHLRALIPGQRSTKMTWQVHDAACDGVAHRLGAVSGEGRSVLLSRVRPMPGHGWKMKEHREARRSLDQRADRRAVQAQDQVALPVARDSPVIGLGWTFADHDLRSDEGFAAACGTGARNPERPSGAQTGRQFLPQCSAALNVQRLVDCLVTDPHRCVLGKVELQSARDLLRAPGSCPPSGLARSVPTPFPGDLRPGDRHAIWPRDQTGKTFLHILAQRDRSTPVSPPWAGAPRARHAIELLSPGTRNRQPGSLRCAGARARWSMDRGSVLLPCRRTPKPWARISAMFSRSSNER